LAESLDHIESGIKSAGADLTESLLVQSDLEKAAVATRDWEAKITSTLDHCLDILKKLGKNDSSGNGVLLQKLPRAAETSDDTTVAAAVSSTHVTFSASSTSQIEIFSYLRKLQADGNALSSYHQIIQNLKFEALRHREYHIHEAHAQTFKWVLDESRQDINFVRWLKGKKNIFWVRGKPGAGKSTLMKYICQQPETQKYLESWADSQPLVTAKYFFWSAGTELQRSQEGLLRSLLYDLLRSNASLMHHMDLAENRGAREALDSGSWSVQILVSLVGRLVRSTPEINYCFFIDGLDEFGGHPDDLIDTIDSLAKHNNVKLCLSSRPWPQFQDAYGDDHKNTLKVESLTKDDIRSLVTGRLNASKQFQIMASGDQMYRSLVEDVVERANGVFLWVVLVVRSLLDGLSYRDSIRDLHRRLEEFPDDLRDFYQKILDSIEERYRKRDAITFRLLLRVDTLPLFFWKALDEMDGNPRWGISLSAQPLSPEKLHLENQKLLGRLDGRYKGLLETVENPPTEIDRFEVTWLHRSVKDFLMSSSEASGIFGMSLEENTQDFLLFCSSLLGVMKWLPSTFHNSAKSRHQQEGTIYFLKPLKRYREYFYRRQSQLKSRPIVPQWDRKALYDIVVEMEKVTLPLIWGICIKPILESCDELDGYIQYRLKISPKITEDWLYVFMLATARQLVSLWKFPELASDICYGGLQKLLEYGADPNWHIFRDRWKGEQSILAFILQRCDPDDMNGTTGKEGFLRVIRLLAAAGANPNVLVHMNWTRLNAHEYIVERVPELRGLEWKVPLVSSKPDLPGRRLHRRPGRLGKWKRKFYGLFR